MKTKILLLSANPSDTPELRLDQERRAIEQALERSKYRHRLQIVSKAAATFQDWRRALLDEAPQVVQFSGHGDKTKSSRGIVLESDRNRGRAAKPATIAELFKIMNEDDLRVECVFLNCCNSEDQAKALQEYVPYVIGFTGKISDQGARNFAVAFYDGLGAGVGYEKAVELGVADLQNFKMAKDFRVHFLKNERLIEVMGRSEHQAKARSRPAKNAKPKESRPIGRTVIQTGDGIQVVGNHNQVNNVVAKNRSIAVGGNVAGNVSIGDATPD